jgi:hypothetical protein
MFDLKQSKNHAHYKKFFVYYFSSKNHFNTFFWKKILTCFLKKNIRINKTVYSRSNF